METKENLLHLFWNCNLIKKFWFAVKNFLMICGIGLPLTAREITLGISESYIENQNTVPCLSSINVSEYFSHFL
jgi:hypothetical protein